MSTEFCTQSAMQPGVWNPVFYQGATFNPVLTVLQNGVPMDFTGYTAAMKVKDASGDVILSLATGGGGITLSADGVITFDVAAGTTAALPVGTFPYDLLVTSAGTTLPIVAGNATVIQSPTGEV